MFVCDYMWSIAILSLVGEGDHIGKLVSALSRSLVSYGLAIVMQAW